MAAKRVKVTFMKKLPGGKRKRISFFRSTAPRKRKSKAKFFHGPALAADLAPHVARTSYLAADLSPHVGRTSYLSGIGLSPDVHRQSASETASMARELADRASRASTCPSAVGMAVAAREVAAVSLTHEQASGGSAGNDNITIEIAGAVRPIFDRCVRR